MTMTNTMFYRIHRMRMEVKARELGMKPLYYKHLPMAILLFIIKCVTPFGL